MADHPNVTLVRKAHEAFGKADMATLSDLLREDVRWHVPGKSRLSGDHEGRDAVFAVFRRMAELTDGTVQTEIHDVLANDEHTMAEFFVHGSRGGKQASLLVADVYHVRNGKVTEFWSFFHHPEAWEEFWS